MVWYLACVYLHILAVLFWIGHMFFWVAAAGTISKRFLTLETRKVVLDLRDEFGQVGWPSLFVLVVTGGFLLHYRGITFDEILSPFLGTKLVLVVLMIIFQGIVGPKHPMLGWVNFIIALAIIGISVLIVR